MLIAYHVDNYKSYDSEQNLVLTTTREKQHKSRVPFVKKYRSHILPVAALYGGNASGKTNLIDSIIFMREFIVYGTEKGELIDRVPFKLEKKHIKRPSSFGVAILIEDIIYDYSFSVTNKEVIEEKLLKINSTSEIVLYERKYSKIKISDSSLNNKKDKSFFDFAIETTSNNQLFLTHLSKLNIDKYEKIYNWFKKELSIISPRSRFGAFSNYSEYAAMNRILNNLDTGINEIKLEKASLDSLKLPKKFIEQVRKDLENEKDSVSLFSSSGESLEFCKHNDRINVFRQISFHNNRSGQEIKFERNEESDGTLRIIDLLPAFIELSKENSNKTYIIDELDRSLHSLLTRALVSSYLSSCTKNTRSQLIFSTHDVMLMDQNMLRRDEMFILEKNKNGGSEIIPFSDYKEIRNDKDIRKSYLEGRLGGIPRIILSNVLSDV